MPQDYMKQNSIPFNFTYFAMKLLGKNLYSNPWTAISEIVANGIDSGAEDVYVLVDMRDKSHAVVEIFDNGKGMSYEDLSEKYTLIGRNKRESEENIAGKTLGRKGIGKLAALYLSPKYYLYTKTGITNNTSWVIDTTNMKDSDTPALLSVPYDTHQLVAKDFWEQQKTGTMLHLSDVDLRKIGKERLKSLPRILADYYLDTVIACNIMVCVLTKDSDPLQFEKIKKTINFDTMYGIFDNTEYGYSKKIPHAIYLTKSDAVPPEVDYPRETKVLDSQKYVYESTMELTDLNGRIQTVPYSMSGWIGIHGSLDNAILTRNSAEAKKLQHRNNALRLYVRGKLAVDNLMNYIGSTQAFSNYIEGEISFDILDDDAFEDASTSNREGYSVNDPRIKELIEIVKKIVRALITERTKIGNTINHEIDTIKKRAAEEARKQQAEAEKKQKEAEEQTRQEASARKAAEDALDIAKQHNEQAKQRLFVLESNFVSDGERYKHGTHLAVNFAKEIRSIVTDFDRATCSDFQSTMKLVMDIDRSAEKIERLPNYIEAANFSLSSPAIKLDLVEFIHQYIESKGSPKLKYAFDISTSYEKEIDFAEVVMLVENAISNSVKANAQNLLVIAKQQNGKTQIDFSDDGNGLNPKYHSAPDSIFELGETSTIGGYGIGGFHMKEIVSRLGGEIHAIQNKERGLTIRVIL